MHTTFGVANPSFPNLGPHSNPCQSRASDLSLRFLTRHAGALVSSLRKFLLRNAPIPYRCIFHVYF